jgi:nucleotide-binding universal stress UspA family protein
MSQIVVGVDGSDHAKRAVRWAVAEARLRGAGVTAVHAAERPHPSASALAPPGPTAEEIAEISRELVLDEILSDVDIDGVTVERVATPGHPAEVLCDLAEDADLLVVGARGLGGFRGLLLGSVTQQVVGHATCPVVVVVPEQR